MRSLILLLGLLVLAGCGMSPPQLEGPVSVNGKVVSSDGKAIGGVTLNLQPLEQGYMKTIDVGADGTFKVETHSGKYAYYFTPKSGTKAVPAQLASLVEANLDRTVSVANGQELLITIQ